MCVPCYRSRECNLHEGLFTVEFPSAERDNQRAHWLPYVYLERFVWNESQEVRD